MSDVPIRTASSNVGCPRCSTGLVRKKSAFYLHGEYIGIFESLVCPICNYSALTSEGYKEAIPQARKLGLVGIAEDNPEIGLLELTINENKVVGGNVKQKLISKDKPLDSPTWFGDITYPQQVIKINHFTKKIFIKTKPNT